jgi:hypothetical protein
MIKSIALAFCLMAFGLQSANGHEGHDNLHLHICAFHIAKDDPNFILEVQHYCGPQHEDLFQCVLYETTSKGQKPKLLGIEYVISDEAYQKLPPNEKSLWHPHEFEIRQGLLATIGLPEHEDRKVITTLLKTWGKTWHTWPDPKTEIPMGYPRLMWSAEKPGDIPQQLIEERDLRWNLDTTELKKQRAQFLPLPPK